MGKLGHWFKGLVRKPLTRVFAPALTAFGIAKVFLTPDSGGFTAAQHIINIATSASQQAKGTGQLDQGALNGLLPAMENGLWSALPEFGGATIAYFVGRIFKL